MGSKTVSSNYSVSGGGSSSEVEVFACILDGDFINDVAQVVGRANSPLDALIDSEEYDQEESKYAEARKDSISALLSWIYKPVRNNLPSPLEVVTRIYVLTYLVAPTLLQSLSLAQIGKALASMTGGDPISRATLSARVQKTSSELNVRCRTMKSSTASEKYSNIAKQRWDNKKEEEARIKKAAYNKEYRAKHRDRLIKQHKDYYVKNRERLLARREKDRRK